MTSPSDRRLNLRAERLGFVGFVLAQVALFGWAVFIVA